MSITQDSQQRQPLLNSERTYSAVSETGSATETFSPLPDNDGPESDEGGNEKPGRRLRKRPTFWTKEEQDKFLMGLEKFGNVHGVSLGAGVAELMSVFIGTRSVPQVRSHAQKFFLRMRKQRESCPAAECCETSRK